MKTKKILIFTGIFVFLGLAATVSLGTYQLFAVELASRPSVQFLQPLHEQNVSLDDLLVRFIARDKEGIEHVELWVDGELYASKKSELPQGSTPFPFVEMWQPDSAGQHVLTARAYNSKNRDTVASVVVQVSEETIVKELPADLPPGNAGAEAPAPGDGVPTAAEEEEAKEFISLLDDSIEIESLEGFMSETDRPILDMIPKIRLPGDTFLTGSQLLEVEALSLETDRAYDGVFCYLNLAHYPGERIPDNDSEYIRAGPGNYWDIQSLLGRENSRIVYIDEDSLTLDIELECWGVLEEAGSVYNLGTLNASHPSSDWDGRLLEKYIIGDSGWFRVGYEIRIAESAEDGLPAPVLSYNCFNPPSYNICHLVWDYKDEPIEEIDGFIIKQNETLLTLIEDPNFDRLVINDLDGSLPTCSRTYQYQVIAYQGDPILGEKSPPSNPVWITGRACYSSAIVIFEYINPIKLTGDDSSIVSLDIGGEGEREDFDTELSISDDPPEWEEYNQGCSYANLWANDQNIDVGSSDRWDCFHWTTGVAYRVIDQRFIDNDTLIEPLDITETLTIGMNVYDHDRLADDKQCYGEYEYSPRDLINITKLPGHSKTYTRYFCESGGGCCKMQYTIKVIPQTPPSDD